MCVRAHAHARARSRLIASLEEKKLEKNVCAGHWVHDPVWGGSDTMAPSPMSIIISYVNNNFLPFTQKAHEHRHKAHEHRSVSLFQGKGKFKMPAQETLETHDTEDILGLF